MICKKCGANLTKEDIEAEDANERNLGWRNDWCSECWSDYSYYVFGEGRKHPLKPYKRKDGKVSLFGLFRGEWSKKE